MHNLVHVQGAVLQTTHSREEVKHPDDEKDLSLEEVNAIGALFFSGVFSEVLSCVMGVVSDDSGAVKTTKGNEPPEKEDNGDRVGENDGGRR